MNTDTRCQAAALDGAITLEPRRSGEAWNAVVEPCDALGEVRVLDYLLCADCAEAFEVIRGLGMGTKACEPYEGCRGTGSRNDLTDDGSGAQVYCDCAAGRALRVSETKP